MIKGVTHAHLGPKRRYSFELEQQQRFWSFGFWSPTDEMKQTIICQKIKYFCGLLDPVESVKTTKTEKRTEERKHFLHGVAFISFVPKNFVKPFVSPLPCA